MASRSNIHPHHDQVALVLQGGGALGSYQAGVYEELHKTSHQPHWIAGVSIGAINAALIAGNPPERRVERMQAFWQRVSSASEPFLAAWGVVPESVRERSLQLEQPRSALNQMSALRAASFGVPGFFRPRLPAAWLSPDGTPEAVSFYDTAPLRRTLEELIDFDLINSRAVRLSVGAANVATGNSVYFDNTRCRIGPEHIMASGALPPAFAPVLIDGQAYWDGGVVSNTPLQYVLDERGAGNLLAVQVDLFSARGALPRTLAEVAERQKAILYSSRTRYNSNMAAQIANTRQEMRDLLMTLPAKLKDDPAVKRFAESLRTPPVDIVHLIYRQRPYELESSDYEFSRTSVHEHWQAGRSDMADIIEHPEWLKSSGLEDGVTQYDLVRPMPRQRRTAA